MRYDKLAPQLSQKEAWKILKLVEACELKSSNSLHSKLKQDNGKLIYTSVSDLGLMGNEEYITKSKYYVDPAKINENRIIPPGSIIFPKRGGAIATNKKRKVSTPILIDGNIMALIPKKGINPDYLFSWFNNIDLSKLSSGASMPQINNKNFENIYISFPNSLSEQKRIAQLLNTNLATLAKARSNALKNLKNTQELFKSYLHSIFTSNNCNWNTSTVGEILDCPPIYGWSPSSAFNTRSGTPVLRSSAITESGFDSEQIRYTSAGTNLEATYWVNNDDLLISRSNTPDMVGQVAICRNLKTKVIFSDFLIKLKPDTAIVLTEFLYYQLLSPNMRRTIIDSAHGTNPMMRKINRKDIQALKISYPSLTEQKNIIKNLNALSAETNKLEKVYTQKLIDLDELEKSILKNAFSGELSNRLHY